ncbi:MAG TPA: hypothetical protein VGL56_17355 [Fimbriimonadaceae bacterium]|jgi:tetratricopeptide (TPR) repeat protein
MAEPIKLLILYSLILNTENASRTPLATDQGKLQKLVEDIDSQNYLIVVIDGLKELESQELALGRTLEAIEAGQSKTIKVFAKEEYEAEPPIQGLAARYQQDRRVSWQSYRDDDDIEAKLCGLERVGRPAAVSIFRARSQSMYEKDHPEESAALRIRVIHLTSQDPMSRQKWEDYIFLHFRLSKLQEFAPAREAAQAALEIAKTLENDDLIGRSYLQIGYCSHQMGELAVAEAEILHSIEFGKKAGDESVLGGRYQRLGMIYRSASMLDAAEKSFLEALVIDTKLGNKSNAAYTCELLSSLSLKRRS